LEVFITTSFHADGFAVDKADFFTGAYLVAPVAPHVGAFALLNTHGRSRGDTPRGKAISDGRPASKTIFGLLPGQHRRNR